MRMSILLVVAGLMMAPIVVSAQVTGALYERAIEKSQQSDYYGAIADFTKVIELYPSEAKPFHYRGICKYNLKEYAGAVLDFSKAFELSSKLVDALYMRGMAKMGLKDKKAACLDFEKAASMGHTASTAASQRYCR